MSNEKTPLSQVYKEVGYKIRYYGGSGKRLPESFPQAIDALQLNEDNLPQKYLTGVIESVYLSQASRVRPYAFYSQKRLRSVHLPQCKEIGHNAFGYCYKLYNTDFGYCETVGSAAFQNCHNLNSINFPSLLYINDEAFSGCSGLKSANFPMARRIGQSAFYNCERLDTISLGEVGYIGKWAFRGCSNLTAVFLQKEMVCELASSNAFLGTPIYSFSQGQPGCIYVPASLITEYQNAEHWSYFSSRFFPLENYPFFTYGSFTATIYDEDLTPYNVTMPGSDLEEWINSVDNTCDAVADAYTEGVAVRIKNKYKYLYQDQEKTQPVAYFNLTTDNFYCGPCPEENKPITVTLKCDPGYIDVEEEAEDHFTISAKAGMTWQDWLSSDYNTDGAYYDAKSNAIAFHLPKPQQQFFGGEWQQLRMNEYRINNLITKDEYQLRRFMNLYSEGPLKSCDPIEGLEVFFDTLVPYQY